MISLLAVGVASASDISNITEDSVMAPTSLNDNSELEIDEIEDTAILKTTENTSDSPNKDTPIINVENMTVSEYEEPVIPFNVTDSNGTTIPGEVIVTIKDEDTNISKHIIVSKDTVLDSFKNLDLDSIAKFNNNIDLQDVYNIVYSSMNKTMFQPSLLVNGISDIYNGIHINVPALTLALIDNYIMDVSDVGSRIKNVIGDLNTTNMYFIYGISDAVNLNKTAFTRGLNTALKQFNMTTEDVNQFLENIKNHLNLTIPDTANNLINKIKNKEIIKLHDVFTIMKDTYIHNNLNMTQVADALDNVSNRFIFDVPSIIHKICDPDVNKSTILEGVSEMINSFEIDIVKALKIIEQTKDQYTINTTKTINEISYITQINSTKVSDFFDGMNDIINGITVNKTYAESWLKDIFKGNYKNIENKILNISQLNTSSLKDGFDKVISSINFNISTLVTACYLVDLFGELNSSMILGGLDKIISGLGANVSDVMSKLLDRIGYHVTFPYEVKKAGIYDLTIKYLANNQFNSANKTVKLIIAPITKYKINIFIGRTPEKYGDPTDIYIYLNNGFGKGVKRILNISLNGEKLGTIETNDKEYVKYTIDNLTNGQYYFECVYNDAVEGIAFSVNIPLVATNISYSNMKTVTVNTAVDGKIGKYFKATLKDENGKALANKTVLIGHNGKTYKRVTNANGIFKFQLNIKKAGTYSLSACYLGDNIYNASLITSKITVVKQTPKLIAKKQTFKVKAKKKTFKVTLKSKKGHAIKGKKIKVTIKGKTYTAKTNKKGIASVNVKLAKKGTYKAVVKFAGDSTYNKVTKKVTLKFK